ncbi:hypothetical protein [uncultured Gammaproteobacteria bacterium]|jgi:hypothetical protein|nr:hypothetical protein [uncultured Gammaproteobacteria bacterium]
MINEKKLIANVVVELKNLDKAVIKLQESYQHCKVIGVYDDDVVADALSIRFARASDIYIQKILSTLVALLHETTQGFIDKINICDKFYIINNGQELLAIRDLRNSVNHEYAGNMISKIFNDILEYTPKLLANIEQTKVYIGNKL